MNYKDYKEMKSLEAKAYKGVNGVWTLIAYLIGYRSKELLLTLAVILTFWIITIIVNPSIAATIRHFVTKYFGG